MLKLKMKTAEASTAQSTCKRIEVQPPTLSQRLVASVIRETILHLKSNKPFFLQVNSTGASEQSYLEIRRSPKRYVVFSWSGSTRPSRKLPNHPIFRGGFCKLMNFISKFQENVGPVDTSPTTRR